MTELSKYIGADVDVPAEISEQVQERSVSCSVSIRESVVPSRESYRKRTYLWWISCPYTGYRIWSVIPDKRIMERSRMSLEARQPQFPDLVTLLSTQSRKHSS